MEALWKAQSGVPRSIVSLHGIEASKRFRGLENAILAFENRSTPRDTFELFLITKGAKKMAEICHFLLCTSAREQWFGRLGGNFKNIFEIAFLLLFDRLAVWGG